MDRANTRILILGAGVIGSIYAVNLSKSGYAVTMLSHSQRLIELQQNGLVFHNPKNNRIEKADIRIIGKLYDDDKYDYVFVTVRYEQVGAALEDIRHNCSRNVVTMINNPLGFDKWEQILGTGRIIPAFPGAGGKIEKGILYYKLTSKFIQPTTIGELSGERSTRIIHLYELLKSSGFPVSICNNMDAWQKSHLAMVIPMANAIYFDGGDNYTTSRNRKAINKMCLSLKENFLFLEKTGVGITPYKLRVFRLLPVGVLYIILKIIYNTKFSETLISNHAKKAEKEMNLLKNDFAEMVKIKGYILRYIDFVD